MKPYNGPHYYHQLGYNDHKRCLKLLQDGFGMGAILSIRDLSKKLVRVSNEYRSSNIQLLIDPQGYDPAQIIEQDEMALLGTGGLLESTTSVSFVENRLNLQHNLDVSQYLVPCPVTDSLSQKWLDVIQCYSELARLSLSKFNETKPLFATVAIDMKEIRAQEQRERLLNNLADIGVDGFYLVIEGVDRSTDDAQFLIGILEVIFRLKWHGFKVMLGYAGPWALLTFPFGLDCFANSGLKNRQSFRREEWRGPKTRQGGGEPRRNYDFWSSTLLAYLRYPEDAEFLQKAKQWHKFSRPSPFAPPFVDGLFPKAVMESKQWKLGTSLKYFSWEMASLAQEFHGKTRDARVNLVKQRLSNAIQQNESLKQLLPHSSGAHVQIWFEAFESYLQRVGSDLVELYK